ncbi:unnamed protein product [Boreogadus saida]
MERKGTESGLDQCIVFLSQSHLSEPETRKVTQRLHLPPDLSETVSRVSRGELAGAAATGTSCGSSGNKHLDF